MFSSHLELPENEGSSILLIFQNPQKTSLSFEFHCFVKRDWGGEEKNHQGKVAWSIFWEGDDLRMLTHSKSE